MIHHVIKSFLLDTPFKSAHKIFLVNNSVYNALILYPFVSVKWLVLLLQIYNDWENCDQLCVHVPRA